MAEKNQFQIIFMPSGKRGHLIRDYYTSGLKSQVDWILYAAEEQFVEDVKFNPLKENLQNMVLHQFLQSQSTD